MKSMLLTGILFSTAQFATAASTPASMDEHVRTDQFRLHPFSVQRAQLQPSTFQQDVDHTTSTGAKFAQRYWVDSEFATNNASPVLFHICGEGDVDQSYFLSDNVLAWAKSLNAHIVYLEHRYYGPSQPFKDLSTAHMQYLTLDNVLEDLASFQKWITSQQGWTGSWISIGGSYSGTLSALYRQKHPELVVGALASSAPMISGVGTAEDDSFDIDNLSSTKISVASGDRQWIYQACTSLGFWLADGPSPDSTLDLPSPAFCQQLFGNVALVNYSSYNQKYHDPFIANATGTPSNILFTYGTDDVWTNLGLTAAANKNPNISIFMIDGAGHHFDLNAPDNSDSDAVLQARAQFLTQAKKWLGL